MNKINLNKDLHRQPFTDFKIINATEAGLKYGLLTNIEINIYEHNKIVETVKNPGNCTFVIFDYDTKENKISIGSINDEEKTLNVYPADRSLKDFNLAFDPLNDALLRTSQHVLIVKFPKGEQRHMILAHKTLTREMLYNDIAKEVGSEFQVSFWIKKLD